MTQGWFSLNCNLIDSDLWATLSGAEAKTLGVLARCRNTFTRLSRTGIRYLAEKSGLSSKTACRCLRSLIARGVIDLVDAGCRTRAAVYEILCSPKFHARPAPTLPPLWAASAPAPAPAEVVTLTPPGCGTAESAVTIPEKETTAELNRRLQATARELTPAAAPAAVVVVPAAQLPADAPAGRAAELVQRSTAALIAAGVTAATAAELAQNFPWERVEAILDAARASSRRSRAGWVVAALREKWTLPFQRSSINDQRSAVNDQRPATAGYAALSAGARYASDAAPAPLPADAGPTPPGFFSSLLRRRPIAAQGGGP